MTDAMIVVYLLGIAAAGAFAFVLLVAPIKLYGIHRELIAVNLELINLVDEVKTQTRLLASIANDQPHLGDPPSSRDRFRALLGDNS